QDETDGHPIEHAEARGQEERSQCDVDAIAMQDVGRPDLEVEDPHEEEERGPAEQPSTYAAEPFFVAREPGRPRHQRHSDARDARAISVLPTPARVPNVAAARPSS